MLKKKDYSQSFNLIVDEYILDEKKKQIVVKGKIDLQEQMNASRNDAFDKIIDRFLNKESNDLPSPCPPVDGQFGEFSSVDNSTYLLELEDYLRSYDGELYDEIIMRRRRLSKRASRRNFRRVARRVHRKNFRYKYSRGGIRF